MANIRKSRTFVLVHGAGHGGWCYDRVAARLRAAGHQVFAPTLPGVAERIDENADRRIDLTAHVDDVAALMEREGVEDAVLCGHSYGGMVVAGVAERMPERIGNLVFLDAVVPEGGARMTDYVFPGWRLWPVKAAVWLLGGGRMLVAPSARFFGVNRADRAMVDAKLTRHPFASLREPIRLTGRGDRIARHTYVYGTKWGFAPITAQYERARQRAGWRVLEVDAGHDVMIDAPDRLADILSSLD